jgi:hypothetical protein
MSNQSNQTPNHIPVGHQSENWIEVLIHNPDTQALSRNVPSSPISVVPIDPLRSATDSLNIQVPPVNPPTGGTQKMRMSGRKSEATPKKMKSGKKNKTDSLKGDSRSHTVKCNHCGQLGHTKKWCKLGKKPGSGGTRSAKNKDLIEESLQRTVEQVAGVRDAQIEMASDPPTGAPESVPPSSEEPKPGLPVHFSSLSSQQENRVEELLLFERALQRCSTTGFNTPKDAFMFWGWRFGVILLFQLVFFFVLFGRKPMSFMVPFLGMLYYKLYYWLWRSCVEKKWFYEAYIQANQIGWRRVHVHSTLESDYDNGIKYLTDLRVDNHALKDAELKPSLYRVSIYRSNDKHWLFNLFFPQFVQIPVQKMAVSYTLFKNQIADIDVYYDPKQLLLRSQMSCLRNQKVAISADDISKYGDIYGNTALLATLHNDEVNLHKRAVLDFLHPPARQ